MAISRDVWFGPGWLLLLGGIGLLGVSLLSDVVLDLPTFTEDALKLLGIVGWGAGLLVRSVDAAGGVRAAGPARRS